MSDYLLDAVKRGKIKKIKNLLDSGDHINYTKMNNYGDLESALSLAIKNNQVEIIKLLLNSGANVNQELYHWLGYDNYLPKFPILEAAARGHIDTVKLLIEKGADIEVKGDRIVSSSSLTAADGGKTALFMALLRGHIDTVKLLIEKGADIEVKDEDGMTPLMYLIYYGCKDCDPKWHGSLEEFKEFSELYEKGIDKSPPERDLLNLNKDPYEIINKNLYEKYGNRNLESPHLFWGERKIAKEIEDEKKRRGVFSAWERYVEEKEKEYWDPTSIAISGEYPDSNYFTQSEIDIIDLLLEKGASLEITNKYDETPLMSLVKVGCIDKINFLLKKGAKLLTQNKYGETAVMIGALYGNKNNVVNLLLEKGADWNITSYYGQNLLMYAANNGLTDLIHLLIEKGADINLKDINGRTALFYAAITGYYKAMHLLIEKGADINSKDINGRTILMNLFNTSVDLRKDSRLYDQNEHISKIEIVRILLSKGADINIKDNWNNNAIIYAARTYRGEAHFSDYERRHQIEEQKAEDTEIVKLLIEKGADFEAKRYLALKDAKKNNYESFRVLREARAQKSSSYGLIYKYIIKPFLG